MMDKLQDLFEDRFSKDIETLYRAVKKQGRAHEGQMALQNIKKLLETAEKEVLSSGLDKILTDQYEKQHEKTLDVTMRLDRYLEDLVDEDTSETNKELASKHVSNLHLLINSLRDIAHELDRHYIRKPHLMFGPESSCGCASCSCKDKKDEEKNM